MRLLKFSLIGLLSFCSGLVLSGCGGSLAATNTALGTLAISSRTVDFGQVAVGKTVSTSITASNQRSAAIQISQLNLTGQSFSMSAGNSLPITVAGNSSVTLNVQFAPAASGGATGQLTIASNATGESSASVALSGMGVPVLTGLTCVNGSILGSAADACTLSLNTAAGSNGLVVSLTSNDSAVVVPASVTVSAGANSANFTANASAVMATQAATLTASVGGVAETFAVQLDAATPILAINATSVTFGSVPVGSPATHSLVLSSTGTMPVTVSAAALTGAGFSLSGGGLPVTLAPGQTATLNVQFDPTAAGGGTGKLSLTSNSSNGSSTVINLSGTGVPVVAGLSCVNGSITGSGTDSCTVTLNAAAASGGFTVSLASNNALVSVPTSVTVAAGASSVNFTANVSPVSSTEAAMLTASTGGGATTFSLQLVASAPKLTLSLPAISFGNVSVNTATKQPLTLSSTGNSPLTISALSLTGAGFAASGATFPMTLNPNQTVTLNVQFDPTAAGTASGSLTLSSNSTTGASTAVSLSGTGVPALTGLSCASASLTGAGTDSCTVTLNVPAGTGGFAVNLASNNLAVTMPASVTVAGGATSATFSTTVLAVNVAQAVTLSASANGVVQTFGLQLGASTIALNVSSTSLTFGNVNVNTAATQTVTLSSGSTSAVTITAATAIGSGFTVSGVTFPITLTGSQTATLTVKFDPTVAGAASGSLAITSDASSGSSFAISLSGTGVPALAALTCASGSLTGAGTDSCNVTLNVAAAGGGLAVNLASNNSAVTVPATVTVPAGSTTGSFTATISAVSTSQTVTLTASTSSVAKTFALHLGSDVPTLSVSAGSIGFGSVNVKTAATQTLTLSSTGTSAVTISAATVAGSGFTISGVTFPITLTGTQTATLTVQFDPTAAGADTGSLTLTSNSSSGTSTVVSLSGSGRPVLSGLSCTSGSMTNTGTDSCTVALNVAAASGGFAVGVASNNSAVTVPASVTVAAGATTASFTATVLSVSTAQTVTLTASANSVAETFSLQLGVGVPTLSINATSISFGDAIVGSPATQSVTLSSTGTAPVTVSAASVSGTGFTVSGATFPLTLNPTQIATLSVEFNPTVAGPASGTLTVTSNSSTNPTATVALSATGETVEVNLTWDAPIGSPDPVAGYNVYRAPSGGTSYQLLSSVSNSQLAFTDTTVQAGLTYDYIVESVDASGVTSAPSNMASVTLP